MIREITLLNAAALLLVSCNKRDARPANEDEVPASEPAGMIDRKIQVEVQDDLVAVTPRQSRLVADVNELVVGMSRQEVKDRLGNPLEESPERLFYIHIEGAEGSYFVAAELFFGEEGLTSAKLGFGHITLEH